ncbi:MAG: hypothetical protein GF368_02815 [Candidatus Aenigmarchaeota archaeon]|nr:hypothetical protein [Candidatus Aenigmarchaeota archaeon]
MVYTDLQEYDGPSEGLVPSLLARVDGTYAHPHWRYSLTAERSAEDNVVLSVDGAPFMMVGRRYWGPLEEGFNLGSRIGDTEIGRKVTLWR